METESDCPVIGILGGIGSGKWSVVRQVTGLNLHVIDADKIGHELLSDSEIQQQLREQFGSQIFSEQNIVDRSELAKRVFGTSEEHDRAREQLNAILHPAMRRRIHSQIDLASRETDAVILDAALLLEGNWDDRCNWLIFIDTPLPIRQTRVRENRGWSSDELARREATQWSIDDKKTRADFVVDNSGSIDESAAQLKNIFGTILQTS